MYSIVWSISFVILYVSFYVFINIFLWGGLWSSQTTKGTNMLKKKTPKWGVNKGDLVPDHTYVFWEIAVIGIHLLKEESLKDDQAYKILVIFHILIKKSLYIK